MTIKYKVLKFITYEGGGHTEESEIFDDFDSAYTVKETVEKDFVPSGISIEYYIIAERVDKGTTP